MTLGTEECIICFTCGIYDLESVIPIFWITKEIMSRGPQVADMLCQETT
jgi:hypothetical protein